MKQLLPHSELAPQLRLGLTMEQRVAAWFEVMDWGDELLLAGLHRDLPEGMTLREAVVRTAQRGTRRKSRAQDARTVQTRTESW